MADRDDLRIFRPRIGGGPGPRAGRGGASFRNAVLSSARRVRALLPGARARPRARIAVPPAVEGARRVIVKAHFVKMTAGGAKAAALHLRYIERDGVEKDGSKGVLYDAEGPARAARFEEPRLGEKHQFRLIVSPEDAAELDLTTFVREYMARVERDLGRRLEWAAVNHFDTGHPHAHIVLRGVDKGGQELRIDPGYIAHGLRRRAQELATDELGPRPEHEVQRARAREVAQDRYTSLDRDLERRAKDGRFALGVGPKRPGEDQRLLVARLEHLERMHLARRLSPASWALQEGWPQQLRALGARGDILKQIHAAISGDPSRYQIVSPGRPLAADDAGKPSVISGRVAAKGLAHELRGSFYAVIETPSGHAYHLPLTARLAEELRTGDIVSVTTRPESSVRPADRRIDAAARANAGLVDLARDASSDAGRQALERRLRELEGKGLATRESPTRWRVASDLVGKLGQEPAAPAQHRIVIHKEPLSLGAQARHPGPVWLDCLPAGPPAPYGFGAEVQRALAARREALGRLGIAPEDPSRLRKLRDLERHAAGQALAAARGLTYLPRPPAGFRGRVEVPAPGAPGAGYVVAAEGARLLLLPTTPALRNAAGTTVVLGRDGRGQPVIRQAPPGPDRSR